MFPFNWAFVLVRQTKAFPEFVFTDFNLRHLFAGVHCPGKGNQLPACQLVEVPAGPRQQLLKEGI